MENNISRQFCGFDLSFIISVSGDSGFAFSVAVLLGYLYT
jgi:hypothetical protein